MEISLRSDIQKGLVEKRQVLDQWVEAAPPDERQILFGPVGEQCCEEHLHVIDNSLQMLDEGTLGLCTVCHQTVDSALLAMDYTSCICLDHYSHYSDEERRQLEDELELSQVVQRAMLPQRVPVIPGFDIAAFNRPAQIIGGDYFDFLTFRDDAPGLVIADVSGHGVSAEMLMTSLQTAFHTLAPEHDSPLTVLERINRLYIHNINFATFVTAFFGRLNLSTRELTYANAGHNPALLYKSKHQETVWLQPTGAAIGLQEAFNIQPRTVELAGGDILLLYTDGLTEAVNPRKEEFGPARLEAVIRQNSGLPADGLIERVQQAVTGFAEGRPLADDVTMVVYKVQ
jgi:sigma-B regulation protein RsbU (phosphoserine phosphatase)